MASGDNSAEFVKLKETWFYKPSFVKFIRVIAVLLRSQSYLVTETATNDEHDCLVAFRYLADEKAKLDALQEVEALTNIARTPANLDAAIDRLRKAFPTDETDRRSTGKLEEKFSKRKLQEPKNQKEIDQELAFQKQISEWERILRRVPSETKSMLGAWLREERDHLHKEISDLLIPYGFAHRYHRSCLTSYQKLEKRWRYGVSMGKTEAGFFYLWVFISFVTLFYVDLVSYRLGSILAFMRGSPVRPFMLINTLGILDYQFSDERHIRSHLFTNGLPPFVAVMFGASELIWPSRQRKIFSNLVGFACKALLCCIWQMAMHNWKYIYDLICSIVIKRKRFRGDQERLQTLYRKERLINAYLFAFIKTWKPSSRCGYQFSHYKRDHEDAARVLRWVARIKRTNNTNYDLMSKLVILALVIFLGATAIGSTLPLDQFAGLLMTTASVPAGIRTAIDTFLPSQTFEDTEGLFSLTAGQVWPSTFLYLANVIYWSTTGKQLFISFEDKWFVSTEILLCVLTLYIKLWSKYFRSICFWIKCKIE